MRKQVRVEREAEGDIQKAIAYYRDEAGIEVALRFVNVVERAFELLSQQPEIGRIYETATSVRLRTVRAWYINDFPYLVFYEVNDDGVDVLAVAESHQDLPEMFRMRWT